MFLWLFAFLFHRTAQQQQEMVGKRRKRGIGKWSKTRNQVIMVLCALLTWPHLWQWICSKP